MQGWEAIVLKIAGSALRAASTAVVRAVMAPNHGALATRNPAKTRLINKLIPAREVQDKDILHFSKFVMSSLESVIAAEFQGIPENEILAAVEAANAAFSTTTVDMFDCSLDPATYADEIIKGTENDTAKRLLSEQSGQLYQRIVFECSAQVIQFVSTWPSFLAVVNAEQLARINQLLVETDRVRWAVSGKQDTHTLRFESRYKRYVVQKLDQLELFGLTLAQPGSRTYPLSTAYISLALADSGSHARTSAISGDLGFSGKSATQEAPGVPGTAGSLRSETAIAAFPRVLLRGDAGSGKSTLLFWLAVNAARGTLENELEPLSGHIPFVLPLRRFAERDLPSPEDFLSEIGKNLTGEMPPGWVNSVLHSGQALVLIDGVDELPEDRRDEAKRWLQDLITVYPQCRYIVTSRPAAAEEQWLAREGFVSLDLLPMGKGDIESFIRHWHQAAREALGTNADDGDYRDLDTFESDLITQVNTQRQLRRLASNPLLCALLCTLNRDRRMQLPRGRMELYAAALEMLLVRRDNERKIVHPNAPNLTLHQKKHILGNLAYWLLRNGLTDCTSSQATDQIRNALNGMPTISDDAENVYKYMMVRSGVLRMPIEGRVDFVHRTFQEYLAAESLIALNDIGVLIDHAHLDQWHEAVTMAVGHARPSERQEILTRLLVRGDEEPEFTTRLHLLAAACLENADELDAGTYRRVRESAERLIPPTKFSEAKELAAAGETVLALLPRANKGLRVNQAAPTVRAAALIGGDAALELISSYATDSRVAVHKELGRSWNQFDPREYAVRVLSKSPAFKKVLDLSYPEVLDAIEHFRELVRLSIGFPIADLAWVRKLPNLRHLSLLSYSGSFREAELASLAPVTGLHMGFASDDVMNACLARIDRLENLTSLTVRGRWAGQGSTADIEVVPRMPGLLDLSLVRCAERPLTGAADRFPALQELGLHASNNLDLEGIENFQTIKKLTLQYFDKIEHVEGLRQLNSLEHMTVLLHYAASESLEKIAAYVQNLRYLQVGVYSHNSSTVTVNLPSFQDCGDLKINVMTYGPVEVISDKVSAGVTVQVTQRGW
ncbi:NACHT domain-containing protein [Streptomyces sp. NPDC001812]|uniref:NACHT domain-containing protein n=1 Tax=Streptomyces sp. NPDC001812 TaxID=3364611 RepID=UPI0036B98466